MGEPKFCAVCGGELVWGICPAVPHDEPWPIPADREP